MTHMKHILRLAAATALLMAAAGCAEHPESAQDNRQYPGYGYGEGAVIFDVDGRYVKSDTALTLHLDTTVSATPAADSDAITRAAADIDNLDALKATARGFSVFASYTGRRTYAGTTVSPDFMCNQQVTWDGTYWNYAPVKYWPNGYGEATAEGTGEQQTHVSFFAYAPWSDCAQTSSDYCVYDCAQTFDQGDAWVSYRLAEQTYQRDGEGHLVLDTDGNRQPTNDWLHDQTDLLYAIPLLDEVKPAVNERLKFSFKHALGTVGDDVTIRGNDCTDLTDLLDADVAGTTVRLELILNSVSIGYILTAKGRLTLWTPLDHLDYGLLYNGTAAEQAAERQKVEANWSPIVSENVKTTRTVGWTDQHHVLYSYDGTTHGGATWQQTGQGVYYIPVEGDDYVQRATVTAHYTVRRYTTYVADGDPANVYTDYDDSATTTLVLHQQEAYGEGRRMGISVSMCDIKTGGGKSTLTDLATADMTGTVMPQYTYDGHAWQPAAAEMVIKANGQTLTEGVDYTIVSYLNNVHTSNVTGYNDDCAHVTIEGMGNYEGTRTLDFTILCRPVTFAPVSQTIGTSALWVSSGAAYVSITSGSLAPSMSQQTLDDIVVDYDPVKITLPCSTPGTYTDVLYCHDARICDGGTETTPNYCITYERGDAKLYVDSKKIIYVEARPQTIGTTDADIMHAPLSSVTTIYTYDDISGPLGLTTVTLTPTVALPCATPGTYAVTPSAATITVDGTTIMTAGTFAGSYGDEYEVIYVPGVLTVSEPVCIDGTAPNVVEIGSIPTQTYDGTAKQPGVNITVDGKTLTEGIDYTLTYTNNVNAGTANVHIEGIGAYTCTVDKTFDIDCRKITITAEAQTLGTAATAADPTKWVISDGDGLADGHTIAVSIASSTPLPAAAGTYTDALTPVATITDDGSNDVTANYCITVELADLTVEKQRLVIRALPQSVMYDGVKHTEELIDIEGTPAKQDVTYMIEGALLPGHTWGGVTLTKDNLIVNSTETLLTQVSGNPYVTYRTKVANSSALMTPSDAIIQSGGVALTTSELEAMYNIQYETAPLTVEPRPITVTVTDAALSLSHTGGYLKPEYYSYVQLIAGSYGKGDSPGGLAINQNTPPYSVTITYTTPSGYNMSYCKDGDTSAEHYDWALTQSLYTITYQKKEDTRPIITIKPVDQTITWGNLLTGNSITATGSDGATYVVTGTVNSSHDAKSSVVNAGTYSGDLSVASGYTITRNGTDITGQTSSYVFQLKTGNLTVNKRNLTVTARSQTLSSGTTTWSQTATRREVALSYVYVSGQRSGDDISGVTVTKSGNQIVPSAATIKTSNGSGTDVTANYNITYVPAAITYSTPKTIDSGDIKEGDVITTDGRVFSSVSQALSAGYSKDDITAVVMYINGNQRRAISRAQQCDFPFANAQTALTMINMDAVKLNGKTYTYRLPTMEEIKATWDDTKHIKQKQLTAIFTAAGWEPLKGLADIYGTPGTFSGTANNFGYWLSDQPYYTSAWRWIWGVETQSTGDGIINTYQCGANTKQCVRGIFDF